MLIYLEGCSEKTGSPNKTVEINENKIGWRKYRGHPVKASGCLVVLNASPVEHFLFLFWTETLTLTIVIRAWIEPGTALISDCWAAYQDIGSRGYMHSTVNHSICFVNPDIGII
jgi:hypothetical protein